jgi:CDP-4-dehydro-6-deoxyglucose reductase/ferredoxin-NAD(P)+ reductase (naphthalene dioxygenase ferredoxin-specific)
LTHYVRIAALGRTIEVVEGETILAAALRAGVNYPAACESGTCATCKSRLMEGEVRMLQHSPFALSAEERARGLVLACVSLPLSDCVITHDDLAGLATPPVATIAGRVVGVSDATHDIKRIMVEPVGGSFEFLPGQFARLRFGTLPERDYSMASLPGEAPLEFHIRLVPGGAVSTYVHRTLRLGDIVSVRGPFGTTFLRLEPAGPILAVAGGSGLAPIQSIIGSALRAGIARDIYLYFGVRDERDLYLEDHFRTLERRHSNLHFVPVLSQPSGQTFRRCGFLAGILREDLRDVSGWTAYLAGPPVMVQTCEAALFRVGLSRDCCHADPFYDQSHHSLSAPADPSVTAPKDAGKTR